MSVVVAISSIVIGCGSDSRPSLGPTPVQQHVVLRVDPIPLTARPVRGAGGSPTSYDVTGRVSFRAVGGSQARFTALELTWADDGGAIGHHRLAVDVVVSGAGEVVVALPSGIPAPVSRAPTRLVLTASGTDDTGQPVTALPIDVPLAVSSPRSAADPVGGESSIVAVGDIADCTLPGAALTARAAQLLPGSVLTLGDHVYPSGTDEAFAGCYESTWGALKGRTYPTPGNHEWEADAGAPYFRYFGAAAGPGYYSFNLGAWHILSLNSNVDASEGSAQYEWARADLAGNPATCTLAYWHHPLFSSGTNGDSPHMRPMWQLLDQAGVDVVLAAHDHLYERFAPQDAAGQPTLRGMRQFVVGTGGGALYGVPSMRPNSEVRNNQGWGVLALRLRSGGYEWEFLPVGGHSFRDTGTAACGD